MGDKRLRLRRSIDTQRRYEPIDALGQGMQGHDTDISGGVRHVISLKVCFRVWRDKLPRSCHSPSHFTGKYSAPTNRKLLRKNRLQRTPSVSRVLGFFCARDAAVGVGTLLRVTGQFPAESTYTTGLILGKDTRPALIATFFARTMIFAGGREQQAAILLPPLVESCDVEMARPLRRLRICGLWISHAARGVSRIRLLTVSSGTLSDTS